MEKIYGKHSVDAVFRTRPRAVRRIILLAGRKSSLNEEYLEHAHRHKIQPEILPREKFLRATELTEDDKHQGICIFTEPRTIYSEKDLEILREGRVILALDQVSNPPKLRHNASERGIFRCRRGFIVTESLNRYYSDRNASRGWRCGIREDFQGDKLGEKFGRTKKNRILGVRLGRKRRENSGRDRFR